MTSRSFSQGVPIERFIFEVEPVGGWETESSRSQEALEAILRNFMVKLNSATIFLKENPEGCTCSLHRSRAAALCTYNYTFCIGSINCIASSCFWYMMTLVTLVRLNDAAMHDANGRGVGTFAVMAHTTDAPGRPPADWESK